MDAKQNVTKVSVQLLPASTVLTVLFVLLKVFDKIDWAWLWVFAPLWLPTAVILSVVAGIGIVVLIGALVAAAISVFSK